MIRTERGFRLQVHRESLIRCIIGMFDISARPYVPEDIITFSVPMEKLARMVSNMEGSSLITNSWKRLHLLRPSA